MCTDSGDYLNIPCPGYVCIMYFDIFFMHTVCCSYVASTLIVNSLGLLYSLHCIAADLTIRVLYTLTLILKDHKAQPVTDALISFVPVSLLITL